MPPVTVLSYQPDGRGGWVVDWRDEANLEGPVEASFHLTAAKVAELNAVRRLLRAPLTDLDVAERTVRADQSRSVPSADRQREALGIPDGVVPYAVRDFIDGYATHLTDCIDRVRLGVPGSAPHEQLEAARTSDRK